MDLLQLGKNPIQPDQPAGAEIRYSPEYEALQAEMDKLSLPRLAGTMDWEKVVVQASAILAVSPKTSWWPVTWLWPSSTPKK